MTGSFLVNNDFLYLLRGANILNFTVIVLDT
jgi:hypothetical protein